MTEGSSLKNPIRVLLVAYGCRPNSGSEYGLGWNWTTSLSEQGLVVDVLTAESNRSYVDAVDNPANVTFHFVPNVSRLGQHLHPLVRSTADYLAFCRNGAKVAQDLGQSCDIAHHVSWTNIRLNSPVYSSGLPVVIGPVGGGQYFPWSFVPVLGRSDQLIETSRNLQVLATKYRPKIRSRLRSARLVIVGNEETRQLAETVGAQWVTSMCDPGCDPADRPRPPGFESDEPLKVLWVGRLFPRKGIKLTIDALSRLDQGQVELTIAGDGQDRPLIEAAIDNGAPITLKGWLELDELHDLYRTSDLLLVTSLRESGGPQMAEALAHALPACVLDHQGPAEFARHGWAAKVLVSDPETTAAELAETLSRLADNRDELEAYRKRAVQALQENSVAGRARTAIGWYRQILNLDQDTG